MYPLTAVQSSERSLGLDRCMCVFCDLCFRTKIKLTNMYFENNTLIIIIFVYK